MNREIIPPVPQTGDIIAFATKFTLKDPVSILGPIIRSVAKVPYNHVGVIVNVWGIPMVYESVGRGFIATPLADRIKDKTYIKDFAYYQPLYDFNHITLAREATELLGKTPYDFKGLTYKQFMWNLFGVWVGSTDEEKAKKSMYCYESMAYLHRRCKTFKVWFQVLPRLLHDSLDFKIR